MSKIEGLCLALNIESNWNPKYRVFQGVHKGTGKIEWVITYRSECNFWSEYELFSGTYKECRAKLKALYDARREANQVVV